MQTPFHVSRNQMEIQKPVEKSIQQKITELTKDLFNAQLALDNLAMRNVPSDLDERMKLQVEFNLARYQVNSINRELQKLIC